VGVEKEKMIRMFRIIVRLLKNEKGLTAIEYALIAALMLIAVEEMSTRL
jgi:Flp pilus assembly pilin Flp